MQSKLAESAPADVQRERVLVLNVDDYEAARYATTRMLRQAGFDVIEAATGTAALEAVSAEHPDIIVLDVNLPDIDGFEVCRRLKANPETAHIPVLHLSASHVSTESRIHGLEHGADGYLTQPVEPRELVATLNALLRLSRAQQEAHTSEERLGAIVRAFALIVWVADEEGNVVRDMPEWRAYTGQTSDELRGHGWLEAVHPADRAHLLDAWHAAVARQDHYEAVYRLRRYDGSYHYVEARARPVRDPRGEVVEWLGVCLDVDARKRAESLDALLATATVILSSSLNAEETLEQVAALAATSFADAVIIERVKGGDDKPALTEQYAHGCGPNANYLSTIEVPLSARGQPLGRMTFRWQAPGRATRTEKHFAEEFAARVSLSLDNAQLFEQAISGSKAKSDFLAVMSHELRTPLNAVLGYTDLLQAGVGGKLTNSQSNYVKGIDTSARHLINLINEVLTFSRIEAGREDLNIEPADMVEIARETVQLLMPLAASKPIKLTAELPASAPLETDPGKVGQILINLISNAVKFTSHGGITVTVRTSGEEITTEVSDTGVGIRASDIEKIFEPFRQAGIGAARTGGTGLGLSVARSLAEMLGGNLTVASEQGKGSTFTLVLPSTFAELPANDDA